MVEPTIEQKAKLFDLFKELSELSRNTSGAGFLLGTTKNGKWNIYFPSLSYQYPNSTINEDNPFIAIQKAIDFVKENRKEITPKTIKYIIE